MATSTRTDTSYSGTLLRLHALEEYVQAEIAAIKAAIEDLEPGGGSGDQDRIYNLTVRGAQVGGIDDVPQGPSIYDNNDLSLHKSVWGLDSGVRDNVANMFVGGMQPIIDLIGNPTTTPPSFYISGSVIGATFGDLYEYIIPTDGLSYSLAGLTYGTSSAQITDMIDNGRSFFSMTVGIGTTSLIGDNDSLYDRIQVLRSRMTSVEARLSAAGIP
ncbi:hypothetical protein CN140_01575 [Sinorhizobium meliloti]|uniref:hypothetical protein n=1 Tax=Rhizobium meliloti TaxID=382 RepID=UPI000FD7FD6A|nr:hypothetical protein [Sinorhizobium meliloti]RVL87648.1 hypothetical protein CN140_01575 [Sinorhizobium meliloti]